MNMLTILKKLLPSFLLQWTLLISLVLVACSSSKTDSQENENGWSSLFNGKDFNNFVKLNGTADYHIEGENIVGVSRLNTPNTFLATKEKYGDFILEFEVLIDTLLNSGVQFRSISDSSINAGRVHGYQCEIESSPRKWAGGIYDEARRGWLYPLTVNPKGQKAFQPNEWNRYRIEAIGSDIRTWVNDIPCARLKDDLTAEGIIAFQVHSIEDPKQANKEIRWRNIRIKTENLKAERKPIPKTVREISYLQNQLTDYEKEQGWKLLWDGTSTKGWRGAKLDSFPSNGWQIKDGVLTVLESDGAESTNGGDIITTESFGNFELELDFKLTKGANSGIKYYVDTTLNKSAGSAIGLEFQLLDDQHHPDAKNGVNGNRTLASLYDLIPAGNLSEVNRTTKRFEGVGKWNKARIVSKGGHIEHWLNNVKVLEYNRFSEDFKALVAQSKYKDWENFGQLDKAPILLQDHGNEVHFRSIKIIAQ